MSTKHQKWINKYFPKSPIAYQPGLSIVYGSINVGIFLSQLLYWHELGSNREGWIYKTIDEMQSETGLSRYQQETAIRICRNAGIIEYKLRGIPAKRHFRVVMTELEKQLPSLKKAANIQFLNPPTQFGVISQTNTKNTQDTTAKISKEHFIKNQNIYSVGEVVKYKLEKITKKSNDFDKKGDS